MEKISVIVPVYNVEAYLEECIAAILGQSYVGIEVLLIDDGSDDTSPDICDRLAARDTRVRVTHKKNGGVSSARNIGIDQAEGQFLAFVDPDDLIDHDMFELLHETLVGNACDISICGILPFNEGQKPQADTSTNKIVLLTGEDAVQRMLYQDALSNAPCGKLFKKNLFTGTRFPEDVAIAEDLDINYKLFLKAKHVVANSSKKYHYQQRKNSAMRSTFSAVRMDGLTVAKSVLADAQRHHLPLIMSAKNRLFMEAVYIAIDIPFRSRIYKNELRECMTLIKKYSFGVFLDKKTKKRHKLYAGLSIMSVTMLVAVFKLKSSLRKVHAS